MTLSFRNKLSLILFICFSIAPFLTKAQEKGEVYMIWGYNRDLYTKSDIRFRNSSNSDPSKNYDFTFYNAKAEDRPSVKHWWHPDRLTIPQYDIHVGYFLKNFHNLGFEVGWNHLKYVVGDNQTMRMSGTIGNKHFTNKDTLVTPDFVHLQHTNGNNYALFNVVKKQKLWASKHISVSAIGKVGLGPLMSVTISSIEGNYYRTGFKYQGWVYETSLGLRVDLCKYLFIQGDAQGAFVDYLHSKIDEGGRGVSSQHFYSLQLMWAGGIKVPL